jgi:predicted AAA+ superfamily ATPase
VKLSRKLELPSHPRRSFFLWGPRQSGKTHLLRATYPTSHYINLLNSELFARYASAPHILREELRAVPKKSLPIIIDEVQKVPALLDEVHTLIEEDGLIFALCGSSARKLRRGHANLLGGRALRYTLFGLTSAEIGEEFNLERALNFGTLPPHYLDPEPLPLLRSYVADYLKEEIAAEGLVRNLPSFSRFLEVAAISDTGLLVYKNIAQDCGVSAATVKEYFQILEDTLLGTFVPAYLERPSRKTTQSSKFYLNNIGVSNLLAKRGTIAFGSQASGLALESFILQELSAYKHYSGKEYDISHWKLYDDAEVDFILGQAEVAIEVKSSSKVVPHHLKGLHQFKEEYPKVKRRILVSLDPMLRTTEELIEMIPVKTFLKQLWDGEIM